MTTKTFDDIKLKINDELKIREKQLLDIKQNIKEKNNLLNNLKRFEAYIDEHIKVFNIIDFSYEDSFLDLCKQDVTLSDYFFKNAYVLIPDETEYVFYTNSLLPNLKYQQDMVSLDSICVDIKYNPGTTPSMVKYNGIFLIDYAFIKSPDNKKYKVFLFEKNKLKITPILQSYVICSDEYCYKYTKKNIKTFVKKQLPHLSEKDQLRESEQIFAAVKNHNYNLMIYVFNKSAYDNNNISLDLKRKIKLAILEKQSRNANNINNYFLNAQSLPTLHSFS